MRSEVKWHHGVGVKGGSVWKKMGVPAPSLASGSCLSGAVGA